MPPAKPWLRFYGSVPASLDYPDVGLYEAFRRSAERNPDAPAYDFFGKIDFKVLRQEEMQGRGGFSGQDPDRASPHTPGRGRG